MLPDRPASMRRGRPARGRGAALRALLCALLGLLLAAGGAAPAVAADHLTRLLKRVDLAEVFPGAERLGDPEGSPGVS